MDRATMMDRALQTVEIQNRIIRIQTEAINDLFILLMEYITVEEADRLPVVEKINQAARLREEIN